LTQNFTKTRSIVEGALLSAITVLLSIASIYLPVLGILATFIWPVPIILLGIRHGIKTSILATIVSGLIVAMISEPLQAVTIIIGFGLTGIALGYAIRKDFSPGATMVIGTAASTVSKLLIIGISMIVLNINPIKLQMDILIESVDKAAEFYSSIGIDTERIKPIINAFHDMAKVFHLIIPGMLLTASIADTFLNFTVARLVLKKLGHRVRNFPPFIYWQFPPYTVALFLAGIIMAMLYNYYPIEAFKTIGMNFAIFFPYVFILQGLSLLGFYLNKIKVSKILRSLIVFMVIMTPFFTQVIMWAGMLEILFNFRKLKREP
jgi:uncharacterized protein YybS (DUF2232 family)